MFPRLASRWGGPVLMIGAGVHGDEVAGPLSIATHAEAIVGRARACDVRLILYPLRNPSGYGTSRYNVDGERPNNDCLRYVLEDGTVAEELAENQAFTEWRWASQVPAETRVMLGLLHEEPLAEVRGVLDLHQDHLSEGAPPRAYHYAFGDVSRYASIIESVGRVVPLWANQWIGAGEPDARLSDAQGFIVRHDGSWPDLMYRIGHSHGREIHAVTVETTGPTPLAAACEVNRLWILGLIDLLAADR
jgi:hypothetical protein